MMTKYLIRSVGIAAFVALMATPTATLAQDATITIGGRLMLDYTIADIKDPDVSVNASEVRRARLFAKGKYGDAVSYKFEFNHTTGDDIEVTDGFFKIKLSDSPFTVKVGHFKTHNSMEEEASSRFISTIERGAFTDAFELNRRLGVSVGTIGDNYTFNVGLYGENINGAAFEKNGHAAAARVTYVPFRSEDTIVHLGGSWRYRNNSDSNDETVNDGLRYRQRPYAHTFDSENSNGVLSSGRIVATPRFAKSDNFFGAEAAVFHNNFWFAGEYAVLNANGAGENADGDFGGGYIEAGIVLGGKRTYKTSKGKFQGTFDRTVVDNPVGEGGLGALALVARYDTLDLQDGPYLGTLDTVVVAADWWPTKQTRLRINYFNADAKNGAADSASGVVARVGFDF